MKVMSFNSWLSPVTKSGVNVLAPHIFCANQLGFTSCVLFYIREMKGFD